MLYEYEYRIIIDISEKVYGIAVFNGSAFIDAIASVSSDKNHIFDLVRRCNEFQLDPIHLTDIISDECIACESL